MTERFIFFVNNQVFGTGCSPFTVYDRRDAQRIIELIMGSFPGEVVTTFKMVSRDELYTDRPAPGKLG